MQTDFQNEAKDFTNPEAMASAYLARYYGQKKIEYPINPFQMLKDEDILFSLRNFKKLEGVYIPASSSTDLPVVGINANRNITRQRFTAAHELCHHFRDADIHKTVYNADTARKRQDRLGGTVRQSILKVKSQYFEIV